MAKINAKKIGRVTWEGTKIVVESGCAIGAELVVNAVVNGITPNAAGPVVSTLWKIGGFGLTVATGIAVWDKTEEWLDDVEELVLSMPKPQIGKKSVKMEVVD